MRVAVGLSLALVVGAGVWIAFMRTGKRAAETYEAVPPEAGRDVHLGSCDIEPSADGSSIKRVANGTVTNGTSTRTSYFIGITFKDAAGHQLNTASGSALNVEPGKTDSWSATALSSDRSGKKTSCSITAIRRSNTLFPDD